MGALMLYSDWVVVVQHEWLRPWSVKTTIACVLSRCQSPFSGGEVASTKPRSCQHFQGWDIIRVALRGGPWFRVVVV